MGKCEDVKGTFSVNADQPRFADPDPPQKLRTFQGGLLPGSQSFSMILGASNPTLAHRALSTDPVIGLLLPCNVVDTQDDDDNAVVSILDPAFMLKVERDASKLKDPVREARERLQRALGQA